MKTVNKAWEKEKEERKRIERYLKHGGRFVKRAQRTRGPNDGNGKPTWYKAGTEATFPVDYKNREQRRADDVKRRKMTRIFKAAEKSGRNPLTAVKKFLGQNTGRPMPTRAPGPLRPKAEKKSWLGRAFDKIRGRGDR